MDEIAPTHTMCEGRVRKYHSNYFYVDVQEKDGGAVLLECMLKGLLKKEGRDIRVGDRVKLDSLDWVHKTGRIVDVLERTHALERPKVANIDQVLVVVAMREPALDYRQVDRYLTHVLVSGLHPVIVLTKTDLASQPDEGPSVEDVLRLYGQDLGYEVIPTSIQDPGSMEGLKAVLVGKTSVLAGLSGVGKSSLLNAMRPELDLRIGEVSEKIARGQHTTRHTELIPLVDDGRTFVADTPGFSHLKFELSNPMIIRGAFVECRHDFKGKEGQESCEFSDCLHLDEPGCVVRDAEYFAVSRYESYREIIAEVLAAKAVLDQTSQKDAYGTKTLDRGKGKSETKIVRLKEKNREPSRRTQRQAVWEYDLESNLEGDFLESEDLDDSP